MKLYDLVDAEGRLFAFEVSASVCGRRGLVRVLSSIVGVTLTRRPRLLSWWREEEFCEFQLNGKTFVAEEPFGDSSRYHVSQRPLDGGNVELEQIRAALMAAGAKA